MNLGYEDSLGPCNMFVKIVETVNTCVTYIPISFGITKSINFVRNSRDFVTSVITVITAKSKPA